jgi:uncharacterized membrane protein YhaH (DUF805 family)
MSWYLSVLKNYATFSGRARRKEYWMFVLFSFLISIVLSVVDSVLGSPGIIGGLYSLAVLCPSVAVSIRRLHDTGRSGWWILVALIPFLGWIYLIYLQASEGEAADNAYGANPKTA